MLIRFVVLTCAVAACLAAKGAAPLPPLTTPAPASGVYCNETPDEVFMCLKNPMVISKEVSGRCNRNLSVCDNKKCIFRELGWASTDDKVNKQKVAEYFNQYATAQPEWSAAVQHLKSACLEKDLPAQGVIQDCAAYDIFHCVLTSFLRNAKPSQWLSTPECAYPRAYAAACPVCPSACFASQVPYGTCNACLSLPRTP